MVIDKSVKPTIIASPVRIVRRFLAEGVTKRNFEYHELVVLKVVSTRRVP